MWGAITTVYKTNDKVERMVATPKHKLEDLLAEMPEGLPMIEGWNVMAPVGKESS